MSISTQPRPDIAQVVRAGVAFVLGGQARDGSWSEWALPPGPSDAWSTAYIGGRLEPGPERRAAAQWLAAHESPDGGWAYNASVDIDADSTAHAILLLRLEGLAPSRRSYERLRALQQPDGGVATFPAGPGLGSWARSHPDVTPVAARALLTERPCRRAAVERAVAAVVRAHREDGLWDAFWWRGQAYATGASLQLLRAAGIALDLRPTRRALAALRPESPLEQALVLEALLDGGAAAGDAAVAVLAARLLDAALPDGSWPSAPVLRLTDRACEAPWDHADSGPLYADPGRLFTTATVVHALRRLASLTP